MRVKFKFSLSSVSVIAITMSDSESCSLESNRVQESTSEQIKHLDSAAFSRYKQKLSLSGFDVPDPYSLPSAAWSDSVSSWPSVDYGNIYNYFVNTPGMYTPEALQSYKSLDSYSLFHAGHVQTVLWHPVSEESPVCILRTKVTRSQSVQEKAYEAWATVHKSNGQISAAHCTCMAG